MIVACTRAELARLTGLTPAAITIITYELLTNGLVSEGKKAKRTVVDREFSLRSIPDTDI